MAYEIVIPRLGWSMEEGTFVRWLKREGELVRRGDALFELEGEKAAQDIEAVDEGILRIPPTAPQPGTIVPVGAIVGYLAAADETLPWITSASTSNVAENSKDPASPSSPAGPAVRRLARELGVPREQVLGSGSGGRILAADIQRAAQLKADTPVPATIFSTSSQPNSAARPFASPRAKRIAKELGIDWKQLTGSGAGGRVREQDVRAASVHPPVSGERQPITARRRVIAQRMMTSRQQTVSVTITTKADATNLVNLREQFKSVGGQSPLPSYQDIITKLVAEVLQRHPLLAARWEEDAIWLPAADEIHIGLAVDTEEGLLVPVARNVRGLSLTELAAQTRLLIERARSGQLVVNEMQGGVFTITNLGAFGIDAFTPVINYPESAILGLGAIRLEPIALDDGQIVARQQITLSLTFDHRLMDGAPAAKFLKDLASALSNPSAWLLKIPMAPL